MLTLFIAVALAQPELWCGYELPESASPAARALAKSKSVTKAEEVLRGDADQTTRIVAMRVLAGARKQSLEAHALKLAKETHDCRFEGIELLASVPTWSDETRAFIENGLKSPWPHPYFGAIAARDEPWIREFLLGELKSNDVFRRLEAAKTFKSKSRELREAIHFIANCDSSFAVREAAATALKKVPRVKCPAMKWRLDQGVVTDGTTSVKLESPKNVRAVDRGETADAVFTDGGVVTGLRYLALGVLTRADQTLVLGSRGGMFGAVGELKDNAINWIHDVPTVPSAWATNGEQLFVEMEASSSSAPCDVRPGTRVVHVYERDGGISLVSSPATDCVK